MTVVDEFTSEHHVYEPHKVGLPPLRPYLRAMWQRRQFAVELARTQLRAQHANTVFGQLWLLINPVLLGIVYYVLVTIIRGGEARGGEFFAHLIGGLFAFYFVNWATSGAVRSVVGGGRLILNTAFPRVLLPLASVQSALRRFVPALLAYFVIHAAMGMPFEWTLVYMIPVVAMLLVLATGMSLIVATVQVYFRDLKSFLPYALRMWMYTSPVLYYADDVPDRYDWLLTINPLAPVLTIWSDAREGLVPAWENFALGTGWALVILVAGWVLFTSREREFAVRL
jgi:ABC-type polysaccharide/polyol phosphate export permease